MSVQAEAPDAQQDANQRYLVAALSRVRRYLERHLHGNKDSGRESVRDETSDMPAPPALARLCAIFGLSEFERDILLLCAGIELDSRFVPLCAAAQGDALRTAPTFSLALAELPGAHWSALTPAAPLRRWRLIEVGAGGSLTLSPLRIDERVLHYLAGVQHLDERLVGFVEDVFASRECLAASQRPLAERLADVWARSSGPGDLPVFQLCGSDASSKRAVAAAACARLGLDLKLMSARALPLVPHELEGLLRIWQREAALSGCALLLDCDLDEPDAARDAAVRRFIGRVGGALIVTTRERRAEASRPIITVEVAKPTSAEQGVLWQRSLSGAAVNGTVEALTSQFSLSTSTIQTVAAEALGNSQAMCHRSEGSDGLAELLWDVCRAQSRPRMEDLAQRIEPSATWEDLVLPQPQLSLLREVAVHVRQRGKVYERWGFASRYSRGLGISLLAAGPSGTGKTMAAEVLANELRLDLYHIDLSQVVSKYIGETERNLGRLFDAAEGGGAVLLFDEADALFGKRSEVKDSHDRYANIEISYLLQRMEAYRGLAILTTNMKDALDLGFLRRIRFVVQFPFPDGAHRGQIWRRIFPDATPTEGLDFEKLSHLNLSGGNIRNVSMNAAFLAAEEGGPVRMRHLAKAARAEFVKLEKPFSDAEVGSWT